MGTPAEGTRVGSYRLDRRLGSGGMGTVFLATAVDEDADRRPGERVAIKFLHQHLVTRERFLERFLREAEVGRQIDHPNVVRTFDVGTLESGSEIDHYLVMEVVEGRTLRRMLADLGTIPESLLREIAIQVAAGLAAIHESGVVHRDLKPENVLVTDDHRVRIMDLGVARLVEQKATLTRRGEFTGSLPYAAPEQFGPEGAGPEADLYSLGVVLYELTTGSNPFLRDDAAQVISAHINEMPQPIADRMPEASPFLSELVSELLVKRPEHRLGPTSFVRDLLERGEETGWWAEREQRLLLPRAGCPEVPVPRLTSLHGRDEELADLREKWDRARVGRGCVVLLEGEAGIGKTRLVDAFLRGIDDRDIHVLYGAYRDADGAGGLSEAIVSRFGSAGLERAVAPYLSATPRLLDDFVALNRQTQPPEGAARIRGDALHAVVCHFLRALAREKPVLWFVEDIHFADPESRRIALSMARALAGHRVLLVLTAGSDLPREDLALFSRVPDFHRLRLGRLSPREVVQLLREALGSEELTDHLGARIADKSDGVPFFVFEMIRGLEDANLIERREDGVFTARAAIQEIQVPSAVRDLVKARLVPLARSDREVLEVAAVQGVVFDADLVARVLGRRKVAVLQDLADIERRSGVVRSGGGRLRFDHHQIREVLYDDLMPELRAEYHALLAESLTEREEVADRDPWRLPGETAVLLARHHLRGSRPERAVPFVRPAIARLVAACRADAALEMADRALAVPGLLEGRTRIEVLLSRAERLGLYGRRDDEREAVAEALRLTESVDDPELSAKTIRRMGSYLWSISKPEEAGEWLRRAENLARESGSRREEAFAAGHLGNVFENLGRYDEAQAYYEKAIAIHRELGDRRSEGKPTGNMGVLLLNRGRPNEAKRLIEEHLAIAREIGDVFGEAGAVGNLGLVLFHQGRYEEAREKIERSCELYREVGDRHGEGISVGNLGELHMILGRYEEARDHYERGLAIAREIDDAAGAGVALTNLGPLRAALGDAEGARRDLRDAREVFREMGARREETYAIHGLGEVARTYGDRTAARARLEEALAIRREIAYPSGIASTLTALARVAIEDGRGDEAGPLLDEAIDLAGRVGDAGTHVIAASLAAGLPAGDPGGAERLLSRLEPQLGIAVRMEAHHLLAAAPGSTPGHGAESRRLLAALRDHAPESARDAMVTEMPLHRAILEGT